jgi:hypothetical protein
MAEQHRSGQGRRHGNALPAGARGRHAVRLPGVVTLLLGFTGIVTATAAQASQPSTASTKWKIEPTPNPASAEISGLTAVSCTSGRACTAVGTHAKSLSSPSSGLAERWNGKTWRSQAIPRPAKNTWFFGVSCSTARACTAVGYKHDGLPDAQPLAEAWNGKSWRMQTAPHPVGFASGFLGGVSCVRARCTAAGDFAGGARSVATLAMAN